MGSSATSAPEPGTTCIGKGTYGRVFRTDTGDVYKEVPCNHHGELNAMSIRELALTHAATGASYMIPFDRVVHTKKKWRMYMPYGGKTLIYWVSHTTEEDKRLYAPWIMRCLLTACMDLYSRGIQHLDMSPQNIVIDHLPTARLIDLGLASFRSIHGNWHDAYGTWVYCPPEVVLHLHVMDTSVVWCLAMIAVYIATGRSPIIDELRKTEDMCEQKDVAACIQRTWTTTLATSGSSSWVLSSATRGRLRTVLPGWERIWDSIAAWRPLRRMTLWAVWATLYPEDPKEAPMPITAPAHEQIYPRGPAAFRLFCERYKVDVGEYNRIAEHLDATQAADPVWCMTALILCQMLVNVYEESITNIWLNRWNQQYWTEDVSFVAMDRGVVEARICEWGQACRWAWLVCRRQVDQ